MFATVTVQLLALYVVPVAPYVTLTTFPLVGPKFVPVNVTVAVPAVGMVPPPVTVILLIAGAAYDTVPDDSALGCKPTVTIHFRFAPTPAILVH